jgi:hypothetical protein
MISFAAIGKLANTLVERDTPSAFDPGSAVELMVESDFKTPASWGGYSGGFNHPLL